MGSAAGGHAGWVGWCGVGGGLGLQAWVYWSSSVWFCPPCLLRPRNAVASSRQASPTRPPPHPPEQFAWSPQVAPLVAALTGRLRGRQLDLAGRAYASISPARLAQLLGCTEAEAAQGEVWEVGR